jgi:hypothetical protein
VTATEPHADQENADPEHADPEPEPDPRRGRRGAGARPASHPASHPVVRWAPLVAGVGYFAAVLLAADTAPADILRYAAYVAGAVLLPGTLVYRALRRTPHSLADDVAMGAAVGLVLELPAWAALAALDVPGLLWLWPLAVVAPFAAVPALRRHWVVRGYPERARPGWSWSVAGAVAFFTTYLSATFLERNPVLPTSEDTYQYLDLAYQLSLAGEAKHQFPIHVPQVADEPLHYHWFGHAHMAVTSLVGHIDLPVVALRLSIPALCAAAIVLTAVLGWRVSGRPSVGAIAAALFFVVGETNFTHPVTMPFGTQASFVIWHGMSMIYSWVLLIALIAVLAEIVRGRAGPGTYALAALLAFASSGAKASSLPVAGVALALTAVVLLIRDRRIPWAVVGAGLLTACAQLFASAVLYRFNTYGLEVGAFSGLARYWDLQSGRESWVVVAAVVIAFLVNMQLRGAGVIALLWTTRGRLAPVQWFLLGGALAGPGLYLLLQQPSLGNEYFTRAGFACTVVLSAWGFVEVYDRARLGRPAAVALGVFAAVLAVVLVAVQFGYAGSPPASDRPADQLAPLLRWTTALAVIGVVGAVLWFLAGRVVPALRGRGGVVALTAVLLVGAPGLVMDMRKSVQNPNGGAYAVVSMPRSRVEAARWVRDHSAPDDVLATNVHCLQVISGYCDTRTFWLSAYAERRVLAEGWAFAPRVAGNAYAPFWDPDLLRRNDDAFTAPTAENLGWLRERGVRWLVVDRAIGEESAGLAGLAPLRYRNDRMAVYEIG